MKNSINILLAGVIGLVAAITAPAQTNFQLSGTQPYYSVSNSVVIGTGTLLANDPVAATSVGVSGTNNYINGTNYSGGTIYPASVSKSRYVAFGLTITTTNQATKGVYIGTVQAGTASGDWLTLGTLPVSTLGTAVYSTNTYSTNATFDTGGYVSFRLSQIVQTGESNYTSTATFGFSSKPGI